MIEIYKGDEESIYLATETHTHVHTHTETHTNIHTQTHIHTLFEMTIPYKILKKNFKPLLNIFEALGLHTNNIVLIVFEGRYKNPYLKKNLGTFVSAISRRN